jgi:hypothetical protein
MAIHKKHGLPVNPLYEMGASRVGCWPCIFARKAEVRLIANLSPERMDEIRNLEEELTVTARAKATAKGEELRWPRSFFSLKAKDGRVNFPIDDAVNWSRTAPGGKQYELFAGPSCTSGVCETTATEEP